MKPNYIVPGEGVLIQGGDFTKLHKNWKIEQAKMLHYDRLQLQTRFQGLIFIQPYRHWWSFTNHLSSNMIVSSEHVLVLHLVTSWSD